MYLNDVMKQGRFDRFYSRNNLNELISNGTFLINLDDEDGEGTHWVSCFVDDEKIIYFDSYGVPPPDELSLTRQTRLYSNIIKQKDDNSCGQWCVAFSKMIEKNKYKSLYEIDQQLIQMKITS